MRSFLVLTVAAAAAVLAVSAFAGRADAQQGGAYEWNGELRPGTELRVFTSRGNLTVTRARGSTARVQARAGQDAGSGQSIRFQVIEREDYVVVCAVAEGPGYSATCRDDGIRAEEARRGPNAWAHFTVELPQGVDLRVSTGGGTVAVDDAGGRVHARSGSGTVRIGGGGVVDVSTGSGTVMVANAGGPVSARTGSGRVTVSTGVGPVNVSTGSGGIDVRVHSSPGQGNMVLRSGSGPVNLHLPTGFSGDVDARTGSGGFHTDFPIVMTGSVDRGRFRGRIGEGGQTIQVSTGSGRISLRRGTES